MNKLRLQRHHRGGFTLVELLVVIAIISILAVLTVSAAVAAIYRVRNGVIATEVALLSAAMTEFKTAHRGYPPDGTAGAASIEAHLLQVFPRRDIANDPPLGIDINTGMRVPADLADVGPAEALYFWLSGFSSDKTHPLSGLSRETATFDFDPLRLSDEDNDGWLEYAPRYCQGTPYVYFAAATYGTASYTHHNAGAAVPYKSDAPLTQFAKQSAFQIIAAGQDANFGGSGGSFPSGNGYSQFDRDNITNFSEGSLEGQMP